MQELITIKIGKFVRAINGKRKETHFSKKWFIKPFGLQDLVNSSVKSMCISFVAVRRIPIKECVCQKFQRSLKYLWVNSVQVAHEGASLVDI